MTEPDSIRYWAIQLIPVAGALTVLVAMILLARRELRRDRDRRDH